jgi:phosphate-selective porin OprO/OprP
MSTILRAPLAALLAGTLALALAAHAEPRHGDGSAAEEVEQSWRVRWRGGLRIESGDGEHEIRIGGRIHNDWAVIHYDGIGPDPPDSWESGTEFRRARIYLRGTLWRHVVFKAQYDFAGGDSDLKDVYVGLREVGPLESVKIGHFKEPFSLEELMSSNHITFPERASLNVFAPSRNTGLGFSGSAHEERMTWAVGAFRETDDFGDGFGAEENYDLTARVTALPCWREDGSRLLHLGLAYSHQFREDFSLRYRQRPEVHLADSLVDTDPMEAGNLPVSGVDLVGGELAWVHGPFSFQSEAVGVWADRSGSASEFTAWSAYGEASYFLTREHRSYEPGSAVFGAVAPKHPFHPSKGRWGAWQLAARVSYLDLNDDDVRGGVQTDVSAALNWILFSNLRVMTAYVYGRVHGRGDVHVGQMRFQLAF